MELTLTENIHDLNSIMFSFKQFRQYDFKYIEERTASSEPHIKITIPHNVASWVRSTLRNVCYFMLLYDRKLPYVVSYVVTTDMIVIDILPW